MEVVLVPKRATLEILHEDGKTSYAASAKQVAEILWEDYGLELSHFQASRLCNEHRYKRPKFVLPDGVRIRRLNSTKAYRRNTGEEDGSLSRDEISASSDDPQELEQCA
jgi:hypothetical protein